MIDSTLIERLQSFIESEGKSCSCDPELINPLYVYRMWGGSVAIDKIAAGLMELRKNGLTGRIKEIIEGVWARSLYLFMP